MKTARFFIFFLIVSILTVSYFNLDGHAVAAEGSVRVSVTIDEYLSYSISNGRMHVATNSPAGFYLVYDGQIVKVLGPAVQVLAFDSKPMIVTANF